MRETFGLLLEERRSSFWEGEIPSRLISNVSQLNEETRRILFECWTVQHWLSIRGQAVWRATTIRHDRNETKYIEGEIIKSLFFSSFLCASSGGLYGSRSGLPHVPTHHLTLHVHVSNHLKQRAYFCTCECTTRTYQPNCFRLIHYCWRPLHEWIVYRWWSTYK
jgi:hypothetical protein